LIARTPAADAATDAELAAILGAGAEALGLVLSAAQQDGFVAYVRLIERWNGAYNLTAVRDPRAMVVQHVLDALPAAAEAAARVVSRRTSTDDSAGSVQ